MGHSTFEVTRENFQQQVRSAALPVLVEFGAEWCPPCKMIEPILDEIADKYQGKLSVGKLDSDAYPEFTEEFGVMGLPTMILFQNGAPVQRIIGFMPRERLESKLMPYLQMERI